jgi:peptide deformylase
MITEKDLEHIEPLKIVRLGHPALRTKSKEVSLEEISTEEFQTYARRLARTCIVGKGVGIASPQVAVNKRVIVVYVSPDNLRYKGKGEFPLTVIVNPVVQEESGEKEPDWEGDLSADVRALVPRSKKAVVTGVDLQGNAVRYELECFVARVFLHEIDHLNGVFLTDQAIVDTICEMSVWEEHKPYWEEKYLSKGA